MARIRTFKPDFWTHPVIGRLPDHTQLLALALLSMADDHGCFYADPVLIRGQVQPFRESLATISEDLAKLRDVGYIEAWCHPTNGVIGHVVNWRIHQKVDHPKPSRLKDMWDSRSPREAIEKVSRDHREVLALEQGTGNREQGGGADAPAPRPRDLLAKHLRRLGLAAGREAVTEWADLMQGVGGCCSVAETLEGITMINAADPELRYARQAGEQARAWAKTLARRRAAPDQALPGNSTPTDPSQEGSP